MTHVAVLGAGAGGSALAVQCIQSGWSVSLWSRSESTIDPYRAAGISFEGALGEGTVTPEVVTHDLGEAVENADAVVVSLPAIAHESVAELLADLRCELPTLLNPGGTGGALLFRRIFRDSGATTPPIAETSTLTYITRKVGPAKVAIYGVAKRIRAARLGEEDGALELCDALFPEVDREPNVLSTSLRNINLVLHPPVALLSTAWVEATAGDFFIYSEAVTPGVYRLIDALDEERRSVGSELDLSLPPLVEEMMAVGSVDKDLFERGLFRQAIASGSMNASIRAPSSLDHRYYQEDLACAVVPFVEIGRICGVATPVADAILTLGSAVIGQDIRSHGITAKSLGIEGMDRGELIESVGGTP